MSASRETTQLSVLSTPIYLVGFLLILIPPLAVLPTLSAGPFSFGDVTWRFGAVGLLTGALLLPIVGCFVLSAGAQLLRHPKMQLTLTAMQIAAALVLLVVMAVFILDALQLRNQVRAEGLRVYHITVAKALLTQAVSIAALVSFSIAGIKSRRARSVVRESRTSSDIERTPLVGRVLERGTSFLSM